MAARVGEAHFGRKLELRDEYAAIRLRALRDQDRQPALAIEMNDLERQFHRITARIAPAPFRPGDCRTGRPPKYTSAGMAPSRPWCGRKYA
ncbi:MAG TPA: hypothetical protein VKH35_09850 [Thermoanaerobaculia bacterium]|nr:hypothetical protein [Thermoanaerobaculia bacterium]